MGKGYTRQSFYQDDDVIYAAHSNDEFDDLVTVFDKTTGHNHDGSEGNGAPIPLIKKGKVEAKITDNDEFEVTIDGNVAFRIDATGIEGDLLDTDKDLGGTQSSDLKIPSQLAVKTYADTKVPKDLLTGDVKLPDGTKVPLVSAILGYINTEVTTRKLTAADNLSDLPDANQARINLNAIEVGQVTFGDIVDTINDLEAGSVPDVGKLVTAQAVYNFVTEVARSIAAGSVVWERVNSNRALASGGVFGLDVKGGALELTLPAPANGYSSVEFFVADGDLSVNPVKLLPSAGESIMKGEGSNDQELIVDVSNISFSLIYNGETWRIA